MCPIEDSDHHHFADCAICTSACIRGPVKGSTNPGEQLNDIASLVEPQSEEVLPEPVDWRKIETNYELIVIFGRRLMGKARLLIVEDDFDISNMLQASIFRARVTMWIPRTAGWDALEKTRQGMPHLIVLDIMLPDIDGYEVCRTLRTNTRTSHIPVIFLTQKDERSDKLQGLELGADDYITKPFDIEELKLRCPKRHSRAQSAKA